MQTALPVIEPTATRLAVPSGELETLEIGLVGEPRGLILILCAAGRLFVDASETMNAFAEHGYATIAVDLTTNGQGDDGIVADLTTVVERVAGEGWELEQIGLVGFGAGGRAALLGAMALDLGAAVSVSPTDVSTIRPPSRKRDMRTPWLGVFGERDPSVSPAAILALSGRVRGLSRAYVSVVCYDAGADFFRDSADPVVHAASFDCWQRIVEWNNLRVAPRLTPLAMAWREKTAASSARD